MITNNSFQEKFKKELYIQRLTIGALSFLLPWLLLWGNHFVQLSSFSQYYYTKSVLFFTVIVATFSILLISYRGYEKKENERWSDNLLTTIAGILGLIVVGVPTSATDEVSKIYVDLLYGHSDNAFKLWTHNIAAIFFIICMGIISFFKFTLSENNKRNTFLYKGVGIIIWLSVLLIIIMAVVYQGKEAPFNYIFVFEFIAIEAFSISWIVKSHLLKKKP